MHISDGVLSAPVWIGGYVATFGIIAASIKKIGMDNVPKIAVMSSAFFVASLIHVPMGPTSTHLALNGLVGIVLGPAAFVSVFVGLVLQAILFQHGGITTIGVNCIIIGIPALMAHQLFSLRGKWSFKKSEFVLGALTGGSATFLSTIIMALALVTTGTQFAGVAKYAVVVHVPLIVIEALIAGSVGAISARVRPEILTKV